MMLCISGIDVCKKLCMCYLVNELLIFFFIVKMCLGDVVSGFVVGVNDYIFKFVNCEEFLVCVEIYIVVKCFIDECLEFE